MSSSRGLPIAHRVPFWLSDEILSVYIASPTEDPPVFTSITTT